MSEEEAKKAIEVIRKSREEIGDKYDELAKQVDDDLKEHLNEEQWKVYSAVVLGSQKDEDKLIEEFGKEKYISLLDEVNEYLNKKLNK